MNKPTQAHIARGLMRNLTPDNMDKLNDLLYSNQNEGHGNHDGSIAHRHWTALRDLLEAYYQARAVWLDCP